MEKLSFASSPIHYRFYLNFARGHSLAQITAALKLLKLPAEPISVRFEKLLKNLTHCPEPLAVICDIRFFTKNLFYTHVNYISLKSFGNAEFSLLSFLKLWLLSQHFSSVIQKTSWKSLLSQIFSLTTKPLNLVL